MGNPSLFWIFFSLFFSKIWSFCLTSLLHSWFRLPEDILYCLWLLLRVFLQIFFSFSGISWSFFPFNWCWLWAFSKLFFLWLDISYVYFFSPRDLSWKRVGFYKIDFNHLMMIRWLNTQKMCVFSFSFLMWWITLVEVYILTHPYIFAIKPTWSLM